MCTFLSWGRILFSNGNDISNIFVHFVLINVTNKVRKLLNISIRFFCISPNRRVTFPQFLERNAHERIYLTEQYVRNFVAHKIVLFGSVFWSQQSCQFQAEL